MAKGIRSKTTRVLNGKDWKVINLQSDERVVHLRRYLTLRGLYSQRHAHWMIQRSDSSTQPAVLAVRIEAEIHFN
jgi:hypothetical protein